MNNYKDTFDFIHSILSIQNPHFEKRIYDHYKTEFEILDMYCYANGNLELVNKQLTLFKDKIELHYLKDHERKYIILSDSGLTKGDE